MPTNCCGPAQTVNAASLSGTFTQLTDSISPIRSLTLINDSTIAVQFAFDRSDSVTNTNTYNLPPKSAVVLDEQHFGKRLGTRVFVKSLSGSAGVGTVYFNPWY